MISIFKHCREEKEKKESVLNVSIRGLLVILYEEKKFNGGINSQLPNSQLQNRAKDEVKLLF